ncbi:MAG: hypothetical protein KDK99_19530 [Verrucomicrobiales bacterium]|nr:hypothetical protein [Verrucomicrobiales bacterium]
MSDEPRPAIDPVAAILGKTGPGIDMEVFLTNEPIHSRQMVRGVFRPLARTPTLTKASAFVNTVSTEVGFPTDIHDHCANPKCEGVRRHERDDDEKTEPYHVLRSRYYYVSYLCTNCRIETKLFGVKVEVEIPSRSTSAYCTKIYQEPSFGSPIPKRLFALIGQDNREHFLQARRAIARSLGIGAYAYYRRIVENTKFDLISAILEVAKVTNAPTEQIELLEAAKQENQFSKAMDMLKGENTIPPVLLIDGHNPLALLHDLLSEGIHQLGDAECLERAKEAEVILSEIAERMQIALTERKAVKAAISSIMNRKGKDKD